MTPRVLIVVFDALRPEFVTPELMPRLSAFAAAGTRCVASRSTFPTETRVNQSAVTTGCYPRRHGVVANRFPLGGGAVLDTGKDERFEPALAELDGPLLGVPSMGQIVHEAGLTYASISAGTSGGGRLINIAAETTGQFRLALRRPEAAHPPGIWDTVRADAGPLPDYAVPGIDWNRYAIRAYLDHVEPRLCPDVMLLWLSEPDESFHWHGIGTPESLSAIRAMDAGFGDLLDYHAGARTDGLNIIAMSDHGQISLTGGKLYLAARLNEAGFAASTRAEDDPDHLVVVHNAGGIWVREPALIAPLTEWLLAQDWCGPLFTRDTLPGTLAIAEIMANHSRGADIVLALASDDGPNAWGHAGQSADNAPYPDGGGCHGGLSRYELENTLIMGGPAFRVGHVSDLPCGNVDILPTVLSILGHTPGHPIDGRLLGETLRGGTEPAPPLTKTIVAGNAARRTHLSFSEVAGTRYLNRAWLA